VSTIRVSCVIPAYNEAATIAGVIRAARACRLVDEVVVVSDGSSDDTASRAARAGAHHVITLTQNGGKGRAVLEALRAARGEIILLLDGDLVGLRPAHLVELLGPVLQGRAEMAVAVFSDDRLHRLMRPLSGQRAIRRSLLCQADRIERTGFGLEMALDRVVRERGASTQRVTWQGVNHRSKREKYGTVAGLRLKMRASTDLARQAGRAIRPRRSPPMIIFLAHALVVLIAAAPIFLMHPSRASAQSVPPARMPAVGDRILVVVAHPDDEVIGAGGFIATARGRGVPVTVLVVTNGDSNRLAAAVIARKVRPQAGQLIEEGRVRQQETLEALARLGVPSSQVYFLGFPDRGLEAVMRSTAPFTSPYTRLRQADYPGVLEPGAPYTKQALVALAARIVQEVRPTLIITHAPFDRHGDHQAVASLVDTVRGAAPVYAFLVHAPAFPRPLRLARRDPLTVPVTLAIDPAWRWVRFDVAPEMEQAKQDALNAYRSQLSTPYLRLLLASFIRTNELFAVREP